MIFDTIIGISTKNFYEFLFLENMHENQKDNCDSNRNSPALLPPITSDPQMVIGRKVGDIANDKIILSQSTHGSIKSINSFEDKKLESPLRNSESERGRGFEPEGKKLVTYQCIYSSSTNPFI